MKLTLKNISEGYKPRRRQRMTESDNNVNMKKKKEDVRALQPGFADALDDHETFDKNAEEVDKTVKDQAKKAGMKPVNENVTMHEDYEQSDYSDADMEKVIKNLTKNFTSEDGAIKTGYVNEKDFCRDLLKKYYKYVDVSDGRRSRNEDMCWVIAYAEPKSDLNEAVSTDGQLADKLFADLEQTFEDNIIPRYGIWVEDDNPYSPEDQQQLWNMFSKARATYLQTLADVIKYVDVNTVDWH